MAINYLKRCFLFPSNVKFWDINLPCSSLLNSPLLAVLSLVLSTSWSHENQRSVLFDLANVIRQKPVSVLYLGHRVPTVRIPNFLVRFSVFRGVGLSSKCNWFQPKESVQSSSLIYYQKYNLIFIYGTLLKWKEV